MEWVTELMLTGSQDSFTGWRDSCALGHYLNGRINKYWTGKSFALRSKTKFGNQVVKAMHNPKLGHLKNIICSC